MALRKTFLMMLFSLLQMSSFCNDTIGPLKHLPIRPPHIESKSGYLTATTDIEITPETARIFISPQTRLPIIADCRDFYIFLVRIESSDVSCRIMKYQKYMILMDLSKDKSSMYFRGGIEAEIVPFIILSGEELPIVGSNESCYFVSAPRGRYAATIRIPKDTAGLSFSKESAFSKLSAEQKKKGLEYFNGNWIPAAKAQELRNSQADQETMKQKKWDSLKKQAEAGVIVLKGGNVLHGTYKGCDKTSVLFESERGTRQYGINDIADIDSGKALALGNLDSASSLLSKAKIFLSEYPGQSKRCIEQAQFLLTKVNPSYADLMGKTMDLGAQIKEMNDGIDAFLKQKNLALYNYEVFPVAVLNYHQKQGHILVGRTWIEPSQLCKRCSGAGEITCAKCQGTGWANKKCPKCENGRMTCHICEGSGYKICNVCGGVGSFMRTCTRCGGTGVVSAYYNYPAGPYLYLSSGTVMVVGGPWFCYPSYSASTCPLCNGTGRMTVTCSYCGGFGKMICPKTEKCDKCGGTGFIKVMCPDCEGRGKVTCPDCKGKGFSGDPQKAPGEEEKPPAPAPSVPVGTGKPSKMVP